MKLRVDQIVKLLQIKGLGRTKVIRFAELVEFNLSNDQELAEVLHEQLSSLKIPILSKEEIIQAFAKGEAILEKSEASGIKTISIFDSTYPLLLSNSSTPPVLLNYLGDLSTINEMVTVAVIGTRDPSTYGKTIGERIGYLLSQNGLSVVSGLALGCDTAAHIGCLKGGGRTVAVLAHGLDNVYPRENKNLADKILDMGGCIVSEYMIGTKPFATHFIDRDRIQAGLSKATIVVETDIKGGTMHTVNFTLDYNRILAAFRHPMEKQNDKSRGNEMLIEQGKAIGLETKDDIDALIHLINPTSKNNPFSNGIPIAEIQLPLFAESEFEMLSHPQNEKVKKPRRKRTKPDLTQSKIFKDESDIRPGSDTDK